MSRRQFNIPFMTEAKSNSRAANARVGFLSILYDASSLVGNVEICSRVGDMFLFVRTVTWEQREGAMARHLLDLGGVNSKSRVRVGPDSYSLHHRNRVNYYQGA